MQREEARCYFYSSCYFYPSLYCLTEHNGGRRQPHVHSNMFWEMIVSRKRSQLPAAVGLKGKKSFYQVHSVNCPAVRFKSISCRGAVIRRIMKSTSWCEGNLCFIKLPVCSWHFHPSVLLFHHVCLFCTRLHRLSGWGRILLHLMV